MSGREIVETSTLGQEETGAFREWVEEHTLGKTTLLLTLQNLNLNLDCAKPHRQARRQKERNSGDQPVFHQENL